MEYLLIAGLVVSGVIVYFLPAIVASERKIAGANHVAWLNLLMGWTIIGWIGLLIWAVVESPKAADWGRSANAYSRDCPACFSKIDPRATVCPQCRTSVDAIYHDSGYSPGEQRSRFSEPFYK